MVVFCIDHLEHPKNDPKNTFGVLILNLFFSFFSSLVDVLLDVRDYNDDHDGTVAAAGA